MNRSAGFALSLLAFASILGAAPVQQDRQAPTTPTDLRVTGVAPYSVSLAWNPSTDNSGSFVQNAFEVVAVDEAGNRSAPVVDLR